MIINYSEFIGAKKFKDELWSKLRQLDNDELYLKPYLKMFANIICDTFDDFRRGFDNYAEEESNGSTR